LKEAEEQQKVKKEKGAGGLLVSIRHRTRRSRKEKNPTTPLQSPTSPSVSFPDVDESGFSQALAASHAHLALPMSRSPSDLSKSRKQPASPYVFQLRCVRITNHLIPFAGEWQEIHRLVSGLLVNAW